MICFKRCQLPYIAHSTGRSKYFLETTCYKFSHLQKYCRRTRHVWSTGMRAPGGQPRVPPVPTAMPDAWEVLSWVISRLSTWLVFWTPRHLLDVCQTPLLPANLPTPPHLSHPLLPAYIIPRSHPCSGQTPPASGLCMVHFILLEFLIFSDPPSLPVLPSCYL